MSPVAPSKDVERPTPRGVPQRFVVGTTERILPLLNYRLGYTSGRSLTLKVSDSSRLVDVDAQFTREVKSEQSGRKGDRDSGT